MAINALRKEPNLVQTREEALKLRGVGVRIADKIEEIVTSGRSATTGIVHVRSQCCNFCDCSWVCMELAELKLIGGSRKVIGRLKI